MIINVRIGDNKDFEWSDKYSNKVKNFAVDTVVPEITPKSKRGLKVMTYDIIAVDKVIQGEKQPKKSDYEQSDYDCYVVTYFPTKDFNYFSEKDKDIKEHDFYAYEFIAVKKENVKESVTGKKLKMFEEKSSILWRLELFEEDFETLDQSTLDEIAEDVRNEYLTGSVDQEDDEEEIVVIDWVLVLDGVETVSTEQFDSISNKILNGKDRGKL